MASSSASFPAIRSIVTGILAPSVRLLDSMALGAISLNFSIKDADHVPFF